MDQDEFFMNDKLYEAARLKGSDIPSFSDAEFILSRTPDESSNVVHIAAQYGNQRFIETILTRFSYDRRHLIICQQNSKGETPLHLAACYGDMQTVETLLAAHSDEGVAKPCWSVGDMRGDTPLHKALRCKHEDIALLLLDRDEELLCRCNDLGESVAYLAANNFGLRFLRSIMDRNCYDDSNLSFSGSFGQTIFHPLRKFPGYWLYASDQFCCYK